MRENWAVSKKVTQQRTGERKRAVSKKVTQQRTGERKRAKL